jgi:hypothetical protein
MNKQTEETKKVFEDQRVKLDLLHSFGSLYSNGYKNALVKKKKQKIIIKKKKKKGIMEEDGYNLLYPVGKYIGIKPHDKNEMAFLRLSENLERIICLAISPNKKFIAVCERLKSDDE